MRTAHAPLSCTRAERGQAWAVHVFTTLGVVLGGLALQEVLAGRADLAIIWLTATLLIDGVDGPVARRLGVKERLPKIDGYVLDLVIDYVTCVIVPAAFMYQFRVVPNNGFGLVTLGFMVLTSAIWFSRTDMETDDHFFRGNPAAWNMIGPLLFLLEARTWVGAILTIVLSAASLTDIPFPHIARATFMRPFTLLAAGLWLGGMVAGAFVYPDHPEILRPILYVGSVYFLLLAVIKSVHDRRRPGPPRLATIGAGVSAAEAG